MRDWEQAQREKGGARALATICRVTRAGVEMSMTLAELEQEWNKAAKGKMPLFEFSDDQASCFCTDLTMESDI